MVKHVTLQAFNDPLGDLIRNVRLPQPDHRMHIVFALEWWARHGDELKKTIASHNKTFSLDLSLDGYGAVANIRPNTLGRSVITVPRQTEDGSVQANVYPMWTPIDEILEKELPK